MTTAMPIIAGLFIAAMCVYSVYRSRQLGSSYAHFEAAPLAGRLGLSLVSGDPRFNVVIPQANARGVKALTNHTPNVDLSMRGAPHGPPLEFRYHERTEKITELFETYERYSFECRLTAMPSCAFPPFEVISRQAPQGPIVARMAIPMMPTGNANVDRDFHVSTYDPQMAALLGNVLPGFAMFAASGIHLVGDGQTISFFMERQRAPILASALYQPEQLSARLSDLAHRISNHGHS